jgi:hypothetical protein
MSTSSWAREIAQGRKRERKEKGIGKEENKCRKREWEKRRVNQGGRERNAETGTISERFLVSE